LAEEEIMSRRLLILAFVFLVALAPAVQECVTCHKKVTPNIVSDWYLSD
jgi:hypothetical protein